jgi:hypothetical protein
MGKEIILQDGKISIGFRGGVAVTADALATLRQIGVAYGMYSEYEELPDVRVELLKEPERELAVMAKTSSGWAKSHTLTRDARMIERYLAFRMLYKDLVAAEREAAQKRKAPQAAARTAFTINDVYGGQHEPTLDEVFGKHYESAMEDVYRQQNDQPEPTFYTEMASSPEPTLTDLFGEQHEPTLDEVFGDGKE